MESVLSVSSLFLFFFPNPPLFLYSPPSLPPLFRSLCLSFDMLKLLVFIFPSSCREEASFSRLLGFLPQPLAPAGHLFAFAAPSQTGGRGGISSSLPFSLRSAGINTAEQIVRSLDGLNRNGGFRGSWCCRCKKKPVYIYVHFNRNACTPAYMNHGSTRWCFSAHHGCTEWLFALS